ncbi:MAG: RNA pyrophosphohydrolase [Alphaproteobacteria bacterium]
MTENTPRYRPNVGLMILNAKGHVFTGQRLDRTALGLDHAWQMPQGGIDDGEEPQVAAYRELMEETGIDSGMVQILAESRNWISYDFPADLSQKLWEGRYQGQTQRWFLMRFIGDDAQINIQTEEPEFSEWKWMPTVDLIENIVPFKQHIYKQVLVEFESYLS